MKTRYITRIALLVAVGLAVFALEQSIPKPLPWLRLGLANIATLLALFLFGVRAALLVAGLRAVLGSILIGSLFNPAFLFSFLGGLFSAGLMAFIFTACKGIFSVIGVSIWGALGHNIVQLVLAAVVFVHRPELFYMLPFFLLSAVGTGFLTGLLVAVLLPPLDRGWLVVQRTP